MGSSLVPPLRNASYFVMSSRPLGFLAPWQPKHDSFKMGATSLMKLTGLSALAGGESAWTDGGATKRKKSPRARPRAAQTTQQQKWERGMRRELRAGNRWQGASGGWDDQL